MKEDFKTYRNKCINNNFFNKEEIDYEYYNDLSDEEKNNYCEDELGLNKYYKKIPIELSNEELGVCIQIRQLEIAEEMNQKQSIIKDIMIFWLIVSIVSIVITIYMARNL